MWLDVTSLANLDAALTSLDCRPYRMMLLHSLRYVGIDELDHSFATLMWVAKRGICTRSIQMKVDGWLLRGSDLLLLETIDLVHLGLDGCLNIMDQCIVNIVHRCRKLNSLDVSRCKSLTDVGISGLVAGCGQLQSINLSHCDKVTNAGVTALDAGCSQLQSINLEGCRLVTDAGVLALSAGCVELQSIDRSIMV